MLLIARHCNKKIFKQRNYKKYNKMHNKRHSRRNKMHKFLTNKTVIRNNKIHRSSK